MLAPASDPTATDQMVMSDGEQTWLASPGTAAESHPGLLAETPGPGVDRDEMWFFDMKGYLVVRGVMDREWLEAAQAAVAPHLQPPDAEAPIGMQEHPAMAGHPRPSFKGGNLFDLPDRADAELFRRCLDHPAIVSRLNWVSPS